MKHVILWVMIISLLGVVGGCEVDTMSNEQLAGSSEEGGEPEVVLPEVETPEVETPEIAPPKTMPPEVETPEIKQTEKRPHEKKPLVKKTHKKRTHETKPSQEGETEEEIPPDEEKPEVEPEEGENQVEIEAPDVETQEDVDTPTQGGDGETETPVDEAEEVETPHEAELAQCMLEINELQTELSTIVKHAEYIEFKVTQSGNLDGVSFHIMYEANNHFIYNFPAVDVSSGEYITLHLQTLESVCVNELGENLSLSSGNESCHTARDLWVSGTAELLHKTDIVYLQDVNGRFIDAIILNEKPSETWNKNQAHFAEITEKLFIAGMWRSVDGTQPTPYDAVNTSTIGTSIHKSVSRHKDRENSHTATDWYIAEAGYSTPGLANK